MKHELESVNYMYKVWKIRDLENSLSGSL